MNHLVKKIGPPLATSLSIFATLTWTEVSNPVRVMSNDFIIEGYQRASDHLKRNEKIAIVNISDLPDKDIKKQLTIVAKYEPAAIGIDYFMNGAEDSIPDRIKFQNIVLPLVIFDKDSMMISTNYYSQRAYFGFVNVFSSSLFDPVLKIKGKTYPSFPAQLIHLYDSNLYENLLKRSNDKEIINYIGNTANFDYLGDLTELHYIERLEALKGKIVLLGHTGFETTYPTKTDTLDSHSTPRGKMFGVVVLANIIHTLMGNYIDPLHPLSNYTILVLLTLLNTFFAIVLFPKLQYRYWIIKLFQIFLFLLVLVASISMMHILNIQVDYEHFVFSIIISPEIAFWYNKLSTSFLEL